MMSIIRLALVLFVALTALHANAQATLNPLSSSEIAMQPPYVCSTDCNTAPDAMRMGVEACLHSAACGFVCGSALVADPSDSLAAPSIGTALLLPPDDIIRSQTGSAPFRPPPT